MAGAGEWLVPLGGSGGAVTLVCLPYAGARPEVFLPLARGLDGVRVVAAQLPGHGRRLGETPLTSIQDIADGLAKAVAHSVGPPYVVLGHSMGGLVGVELVRALHDFPAPAHFIVSACRAPAEPWYGKPWHTLPDDDLVAVLTSLGADPEPLAVPAVRAFALPMLRADLEAVENFDGGPRPPLRCPITAITGTLDPHAGPGLMNGWARETAESFRIRLVEGGHFLLEERPDDIEALVRDVLAGR